MPQDPKEFLTPDEYEEELAKQWNIPRGLLKSLTRNESSGSHTDKQGKVTLGIDTGKGRGKAVGKYQVLRSTAKNYGVDNPDDPYDNIYVGLKNIKEGYDAAAKHFDDEDSRWAGALTYYHGGPRNLNKAAATGEVPKTSDKLTTTAAYVKDIMSRWKASEGGGAEFQDESPEGHGTAAPQVPQNVPRGTPEVRGQLKLNQKGPLREQRSAALDAIGLGKQKVGQGEFSLAQLLAMPKPPPEVLAAEEPAPVDKATGKPVERNPIRTLPSGLKVRTATPAETMRARAETEAERQAAQKESAGKDLKFRRNFKEVAARLALEKMGGGTLPKVADEASRALGPLVSGLQQRVAGPIKVVENLVNLAEPMTGVKTDVGQMMQREATEELAAAPAKYRWTTGLAGQGLGMGLEMAALGGGTPLKQAAKWGAEKFAENLDQGVGRAAIEGGKSAATMGVLAKMGQMLPAAGKTIAAAKAEYAEVQAAARTAAEQAVRDGKLAPEAVEAAVKGISNEQARNIGLQAAKEILAKRAGSAGITGSTAAGTDIADQLISTGQVDWQRTLSDTALAAGFGAIVPGQKRPNIRSPQRVGVRPEAEPPAPGAAAPEPGAPAPEAPPPDASNPWADTGQPKTAQNWYARKQNANRGPAINQGRQLPPGPVEEMPPTAGAPPPGPKAAPPPVDPIPSVDKMPGEPVGPTPRTVPKAPPEVGKNSPPDIIASAVRVVGNADRGYEFPKGWKLAPVTAPTAEHPGYSMLYDPRRISLAQATKYAQQQVAPPPEAPPAPQQQGFADIPPQPQAPPVQPPAPAAPNAPPSPGKQPIPDIVKDVLGANRPEPGSNLPHGSALSGRAKPTPSTGPLPWKGMPESEAQAYQQGQPPAAPTARPMPPSSIPGMAPPPEMPLPGAPVAPGASQAPPAAPTTPSPTAPPKPSFRPIAPPEKTMEDIYWENVEKENEAKAAKPHVPAPPAPEEAVSFGDPGAQTPAEAVAEIDLAMEEIRNDIKNGIGDFAQHSQDLGVLQKARQKALVKLEAEEEETARRAQQEARLRKMDEAEAQAKKIKETQWAKTLETLGNKESKAKAQEDAEANEKLRKAGKKTPIEQEWDRLLSEQQAEEAEQARLTAERRAHKQAMDRGTLMEPPRPGENPDEAAANAMAVLRKIPLKEAREIVKQQKKELDDLLASMGDEAPISQNQPGGVPENAPISGDTSVEGEPTLDPKQIDQSIRDRMVDLHNAQTPGQRQAIENQLKGLQILRAKQAGKAPAAAPKDFDLKPPPPARVQGQTGNYARSLFLKGKRPDPMDPDVTMETPSFLSLPEVQDFLQVPPDTPVKNLLKVAHERLRDRMREFKGADETFSLSQATRSDFEAFAEKHGFTPNAIDALQGNLAVGDQLHAASVAKGESERKDFAKKFRTTPPSEPSKPSEPGAPPPKEPPPQNVDRMLAAWRRTARYKTLRETLEEYLPQEKRAHQLPSLVRQLREKGVGNGLPADVVDAEIAEITGRDPNSFGEGAIMKKPNRSKDFVLEEEIPSAPSAPSAEDEGFDKVVDIKPPRAANKKTPASGQSFFAWIAAKGGIRPSDARAYDLYESIPSNLIRKSSRYDIDDMARQAADDGYGDYGDVFNDKDNTQYIDRFVEHITDRKRGPLDQQYSSLYEKHAQAEVEKEEAEHYLKKTMDEFGISREEAEAFNNISNRILTGKGAIKSPRGETVQAKALKEAYEALSKTYENEPPTRDQQRIAATKFRELATKAGMPPKLVQWTIDNATTPAEGFSPDDPIMEARSKRNPGPLLFSEVPDQDTLFGEMAPLPPEPEPPPDPDAFTLTAFEPKKAPPKLMGQEIPWHESEVTGGQPDLFNRGTKKFEGQENIEDVAGKTGQSLFDEMRYRPSEWKQEMARIKARTADAHRRLGSLGIEPPKGFDYNLTPKEQHALIIANSKAEFRPRTRGRTGIVAVNPSGMAGILGVIQASGRDVSMETAGGAFSIDNANKLVKGLMREPGLEHIAGEVQKGIDNAMVLGSPTVIVVDSAAGYGSTRFQIGLRQHELWHKGEKVTGMGARQSAQGTDAWMADRMTGMAIRALQRAGYPLDPKKLESETLARLVSRQYEQLGIHNPEAALQYLERSFWRIVKNHGAAKLSEMILESEPSVPARKVYEKVKAQQSGAEAYGGQPARGTNPDAAATAGDAGRPGSVQTDAGRLRQGTAGGGTQRGVEAPPGSVPVSPSPAGKTGETVKVTAIGKDGESSEIELEAYTPPGGPQGPAPETATGGGGKKPPKNKKKRKVKPPDPMDPRYPIPPGEQNLPGVERPGKKIGILEGVNAVHTPGMLASVKFATRNVGGHAVMYPMRMANDFTAALMEHAYSKAYNKVIRSLKKDRPLNERQLAYPNLDTVRANVKGGITAAKRALELRKGEQTGIYYGGEYISRAAVRKVWGKRIGGVLDKTMFYANYFPDEIVRGAYYEGALENIIRAKMAGGHDWSPMEMKDRAFKEAAQGALRDPNVISGALSALKYTLNAGQAYGMGDWTVKFPNIPGAIAKRAFEHGPFGLLDVVNEAGGFDWVDKPLKATVRALPWGRGKKVGKQQKKHDVYRQRAVFQALARVFNGSAALLGGGAWLGLLGVITPEAETGPQGKLDREEGLQPYAINVSAIGRLGMNAFNPLAFWANLDYQPRTTDKIYSMDWAQPIAASLAAGAHIGHTLRKNHSKNQARRKGLAEVEPNDNLLTTMTGMGRVASDSFASMLDAISDNTVLKNVVRYFGSTGLTLGQAALNALKDQPASFVPAVSPQVRRWFDNVDRDTRVPGGGFLNGVKEAFIKRPMSRIPFLSKMLPEKPTTYGQTAKRPTDSMRDNVLGKDLGFLGRVLNTSVLPYTATEFKTSEFSEAMRRINKVGGAPEFQKAKEDEGIPGETQEQWKERATVKGQLLEAAGNKLMESEAYKTAPPALQDQMVKTTLEHVQRGSAVNPAQIRQDAFDSLARAAKREGVNAPQETMKKQKKRLEDLLNTGPPAPRGY